jgi:hypothetical protein
MLLCAEVNAEDFRVIHHEMGHVEYYMAYRNQPIVFQVHASHCNDSMQINIHTQEVGIQEVLNLNLSPKSSSYN